MSSPIKGLVVTPRRRENRLYLKGLTPLTQVYRDNVVGLNEHLFPIVTGLYPYTLKKLKDNYILKTVKFKGQTYILKDRYWLGFLRFLKSKGMELNEFPNMYSYLKQSKKV